MLLSELSGRTNSVVQFLTVLLLFVFVIFITWFTTRWIAKIQKGQMAGGANLETIETMRVGADKYLQIVRAGEKYLVIAIGKNEVHMLTEIPEDELIFNDDAQKSVDFSAVFEKVKNLNKKSGE